MKITIFNEYWLVNNRVNVHLPAIFLRDYLSLNEKENIFLMLAQRKDQQPSLYVTDDFGKEFLSNG